MYLQSINSDKHLLQSPFTGQFFRRQHFTFVSIKLISPWCEPMPFLVLSRKYMYRALGLLLIFVSEV
jgi:hypothetical protein